MTTIEMLENRMITSTRPLITGIFALALSTIGKTSDTYDRD